MSNIAIIILCSVLLTGTFARDPRCPLDGSQIYFPHETDCRLFYQCNAAGDALLYECEPGLEFHPTYLVCAWAADFCISGPSTEIPTTTEEPTTTTTEIPTTTTEEPTTTTEEPTTTTEEPTTTTEEPTTTTEEPTTTTEEPTTTTEEPTTTTEEPTTTTEEPTTTTTEEPTTTTEEPTTTTTEPTTTTEEPTTTTTEEPTTTTTEEPTTTTEEPTTTAHPKDQFCPEVDDPLFPIHLEHSTDCAKFYTCVNGRVVEMSCAEGTYWDQAAGWCVLAEMVECLL